MTLVMSSAILCTNPGSQTGELLVGYPFSAVSTSQSTESMLLKLRVYLGSVLYRPENIIVLPHVAFEGVKSGYQVAGIAAPVLKFENGQCPDALIDELKKPVANMRTVAENLDDGSFGRGNGDWLANRDTLFEKIDTNKYRFKEDNDLLTALISRGTSVTEETSSPTGFKTVTTNVGHLGCVDSPECADRIWGTAGGQVYKAQPGRL